MVRSFSIAALAVILPAFATAQEAKSHTVVSGNTLWGLAGEYLGDPYQWPRIHDANQDRVPNPHRIDPGLELIIPGALPAGTVTAVLVVPGPAGDQGATQQVAAAEQAVETVPQAGPQRPAASETPAAPRTALSSPDEPQPFLQQVPDRTVFYHVRPTEVNPVANAAPVWEVAPDQFYSAPWLIPPGTVPESVGVLDGFEGSDDLRNPRSTARVFDRVQVRISGPFPAVGSRLQLLRVTRSVVDVGDVVQPTGILLIEATTPAGVVAVVESQFGRIELGDLVRALPPYAPAPAGSTTPASGGRDATVLAYARERELQTLSEFAFLDVGAADGVRIGDEYVAVVEDSPDFGPVLEGRLKVVSVLENVATARILSMENPVFPPGVRLRPDRRAR
jgi:hypothetical protein